MSGRCSKYNRVHQLRTTGQYNTKGYDTITDEIGAIILRPDIYNNMK